jgi:6,7-dimethyl-8-ribityllumazine synthase
MTSVFRGEPNGRGRRVAIAVARFHEPLTERLLQGALTALHEAGTASEDIAVAWVPGAFELPLAARAFCDRGEHDAVVVLGAVIRGDTDHYDYVCRAAADGTLRVSLDTGVPVAFGVLTCDDWQQALDRAGGQVGNKGADAVMAALAMVDLRQAIAGAPARTKGKAGS